MTTFVEEMTSSLPGHVTFLSSPKLSWKNVIIFLTAASFPLLQGRQDLNPQHPVLETGALPLELLAYGNRDPYFTFASLCSVCFLSHRQYFENSSFPCVFLRFFV